MTTIIVVIVAVLSFALLYGMLSRETGFKILTTTDGKPRFGVPKMLKNFLNEGNSEGEKSLSNERFWLLGFIVVAVITILLYTVLDEESSDRWKTVGLITLVGMHVFIFWNFSQALLYEDKLHPATKFFVGACLVFWSIALFVPNFAQEMVKGTKGMVTTFDDRFNPEKALAKEKTEQQPSVAGYQPRTQVIQKVFEAVPQGDFQEMEIPSGTRVIENLTWDCPRRCILEVEHDGQRMCDIGDGSRITYSSNRHMWYVGEYKNVTCSVAGDNYTEGHVIEHFYVDPGANKIVFPKNLLNVVSRFGTDEVLGPVSIKVTMRISG